MRRRDMMKLGLVSGLVAGHRFSWAGSPESPALLLEAGQFQDHGGWGLDSQFMDQMGSGYLIAHGIGNPVEDAVAMIKLPEAGTYRLWVRTRDWVAPWKAPDTSDAKRASGTPGIFRVLVNGTPVETVFGDRNAEWHWQDGGMVEFETPSAEIALRDLTGFAGRCAGIFLTKDQTLVPPNRGTLLARFRRKWHGYSEVPEDAGTYDLVVVGGGVAGMCAAVVAAQHGVKVALVQDRPMVGGNNSSEVRMHLSGTARSNYSKTLGDVLAQIDVPNDERSSVFEGGRPMHTGSAFMDKKKNRIVQDEENIAFFPMYRMNQVEMKAGRIGAVVAENIASSRRLRFEGAYFVDSTGDGCVGFLAGADFEISANEHMGRSNQWSVRDVGNPTKFPRCPWALDLGDKPFPGRKQARAESLPEFVNHFGNWYWESGFGHDPIEKGEYIRDWNFRAMYGAWDAVKNVLKGYPTHDLAWAAFISGMRESRRLMGDLVLNREDVCKPNWYDDGIVPTGWKIDVHFPDPRYNKGFEGDAFISKVDFEKCVRPYYIPYRCFYSRNIPNLFMAGRDISVTREALGTVRVMRTTGLMGEVVGHAAGICIARKIDPRGVYEKYLAELKAACGMDPDVIAADGKMSGRRSAPVKQGITVVSPGHARRATEDTSKYAISQLSEELVKLRSIVVPRGKSHKPGAEFAFKISKPATIFLAVHQRGGFTPSSDWQKTNLKLTWFGKYTDVIYRKKVSPGRIEIPPHTGREGKNFGLPHMVFVEAGEIEPVE